MTRQPDDIERYIRLTESSDLLGDDNISIGSIEVQKPDSTHELFEDIRDMIFKFRSYNEEQGSEDYIQGVEEGLELAANMLESLLDKQSNPFDD